MQDNPYSKLLDMQRGDTKAQSSAIYRIGHVKSAAPLIVDVSGALQEDEDLAMNAALGALAEGDRLLMLPIEDEQRYIIICKVVGL